MPGHAPSVRRTAHQNEDVVLQVLHDAAAPPSAYDIAQQAHRHGAALAPAQVYRTLDRLIAQGRAVRIETRNAYALRRPDDDLHLICNRCQALVAITCPQLPGQLRALAGGAAFDMCRGVVEVRGTCARCRQLAEASTNGHRNPASDQTERR